MLEIVGVIIIIIIKVHQNLFSAKDLAQTPLGELTVLPICSSWLERVTSVAYRLPLGQHLLCLNLGISINRTINSFCTKEALLERMIKKNHKPTDGCNIQLPCFAIPPLIP